MRVTNTMMRNNSMLNMQKNKVAYNKYLNQYKAADEKSKNIAKKLIRLEEKLETDIRRYL